MSLAWNAYSAFALSALNPSMKHWTSCFKSALSAVIKLHDQVVIEGFRLLQLKPFQESHRHERIRTLNSQRHLSDNPPLNVRQKCLINLRTTDHEQVCRQ